MNITLFDDPEVRANLLPFTFTRPVAGIRVGTLTISEKWERLSEEVISFLTQDYLQRRFPQLTGSDSNLYVNGAVCPTEALLRQIQVLPVGQNLVYEGVFLALNAGPMEIRSVEELYQHNTASNSITFPEPLQIIRQPWHIFQLNGDQIRADFKLITQGRASQPVADPHTIVYNPENVFLEKGAKVKAAILNAENGPIYIGKNAEVHEGAIIRGPFSLCQESHVNVGGKMRGDISIGPYCKVGGEVNNSVFFGYSNKGHEGFLGNSVVGEWCNFGADTNASNLKNNYAPVKIYSHAQNSQVDTGLQFCGLFMADHAKCGINTMFNTGTVVGVGANIFGAGYPPAFVPSFSWGGGQELVTFRLPKFFEIADAVLGRRGMKMDEEERDIYAHVFDVTHPTRTWEGTPLKLV